MPTKLPPEATAAPLVPSAGGIAQLREAAVTCRACDLGDRGTQTVFGAGPDVARAVFVGEQPGNEEDLEGAPFVGPAGRLLDQALEAAGIDRRLVYVTNVVKHFKWEARGKRRLHVKPNAREIAACRPWLDAELDRIRPRVLVCLGATAAQALLGKSFRVTQERGRLIEGHAIAPVVMATVHPSSVLRAPDDETRRRERARFFEDVARIAPLLHDGQP
jgi:DNA polymerase